MNTRLNQIDLNTNELRELVTPLTSAELNWKPNPTTWSVAQNLDHIITINQSYFPAFKAIKEGTQKLPFTSKFGFLVKMFGQQILKSVQPETKKKMKTFEIWEPQTGKLPDDIFTLFEAHQEKLKQHFTDLETANKTGTLISSPANKYIVYKLVTAFDIIITHEKRHIEQSKALLNQMRNV